jgi:hypothetical protein
MFFKNGRESISGPVPPVRIIQATRQANMATVSHVRAGKVQAMLAQWHPAILLTRK